MPPGIRHSRAIFQISGSSETSGKIEVLGGKLKTIGRGLTR